MQRQQQQGMNGQSINGSSHTQSQGQRISRPQAPPRMTSYSKRHASFDSPREVPLPSPSIRQSESSSFFASPTTASHAQVGSWSKAQEAPDSRSYASPPSQPSSPTRATGGNHSHSHSQSYRHSDVFDEDASDSAVSGSKSPLRAHTPPSPWGMTQDSDALRSSWRQMQQHRQHMSSFGVNTASPASGYSTSELATQKHNGNGSAAHPPSQTSPQSKYSAASGSGAAPVYTSSRPFSLPDAHSHSYHGAVMSLLPQPDPSSPLAATLRSTTWADRCSSASLPLPNQIPFYALERPMVGEDDMRCRDNVPTASSSVRACPSSSGDQSGTGTAGSPTRSAFRRPTLTETSTGSSSGSSSSSSGGSSSYGSSGSLPSVSGSGSDSDGRPALPSPSSDATSVSTSCSKPSSIQNTTQSILDSALPARPTSPFRAPVPQRPVSPFRAPQPPPPPAQQQRPVSPFRAPQRPISPFRAPQPPTRSPVLPQVAQATAMGRFMSPSPVYPPPEPPIILPNDASSDITSAESRTRMQAPYQPFLSHAPPPADSWIEVETTLPEYRLHVRLPGFQREGITLATKRRRILHVVADSWDNGGGHFERRISFGYDADLTQVRAEFDGVMLRVTIPRRQPAVYSFSSPVRTAPLGRV